MTKAELRKRIAAVKMEMDYTRAKCFGAEDDRDLDTAVAYWHTWQSLRLSLIDLEAQLAALPDTPGPRRKDPGGEKRKTCSICVTRAEKARVDEFIKQIRAQ